MQPSSGCQPHLSALARRGRRLGESSGEARASPSEGSRIRRMSEASGHSSSQARAVAAAAPPFGVRAVGVATEARNPAWHLLCFRLPLSLVEHSRCRPRFRCATRRTGAAVLGLGFLKISGAARRRCDWPRPSNLYANEAAPPPLSRSPSELAGKGHSRRGWASAPRTGRAGTPEQPSGASVSPALRGRLASFAAPSPWPHSPPFRSPPACLLAPPSPRSSLKGVLGFL